MELRPPASAVEGRPVTMRAWAPLAKSIFVMLPVAPIQMAPSGAAAHGPGPPEPASATYRAPSGPKASPRGLLRPRAITSAGESAAIACAHINAQTTAMFKLNRVIAPPVVDE